MRKGKFTASGLVFDSAVAVMDDVLDFTIERFGEHQAAVAVYGKMRECLAEARRNLRGLLKKGWFKGRERERCLARARELRQAELLLGDLMKSSQLAADIDGAFLQNVGRFEGVKELMSGFKIVIKESPH
jgi:hypothetical protein